MLKRSNRSTIDLSMSHADLDMREIDAANVSYNYG